ncbi:MAG: LamG-like jellyroll fold domain-containing protein, partial [Verrucomicrobiota bacterium]
ASNEAFNCYAPPEQIDGRPFIDHVGSPSNIMPTEALLSADLVSTGLAPTTVTLFWGEADGGTNAGAWASSAPFGIQGPGLQQLTVTGLTPDRYYYYRFMAMNAFGERWADRSGFFLPGQISMTAIDAAAAEAGADPGVFRISRAATATGLPETVFFTIGGTAENGVDYTSIVASVTLPAGVADRDITITPIDDLTFGEGSETVSLTLQPGPFVMGSSNAVVTIADDDGLDNWTHRMKLTFPGYTRNEVLTDFPLMIELGPHLPQFSYDFFASPLGWDLRVFDSNAVSMTQLDLEIERWNTNGSSYVWVKVPAFSSNTCLWAYWGNPAAEVLTAPAGEQAWNSDFRGVWHLNNSVLDSTSNNTDGTVFGGLGSVSASGKVANAWNFDAASNAFIQMLRPIEDDFTINLLMQADLNSPNAGNNWPIGAGLVGGALSGTRADLGVVYNDQTVQFGAVDGDTTEASTSVNDGQWHLVTVTRERATGTEVVYVNGIEEARSVSESIASLADNTFLAVGDSEGDGSGINFDGRIDELRMSDSVRSSNWIWAVWNNLCNPLFGTNGVVVSDYPFVRNLPATTIETNSTVVNGALDSTGSTATAVTLFWGTNDGGKVVSAWSNAIDYGLVSFAPPVLFNTNLTGLQTNKIYYYTFYATNSVGEAWSIRSESFKTLGPPRVSNAGIVQSVGSVELMGILDNGSHADITIFWGDTDGGTNPSAWQNAVALGDQPDGLVLSTVASNLLYGVCYYYRTYASNDAGEAWADATTPFNPLTSLQSAPEGLVVREFDNQSGSDEFSPISVLQG